MRKRLGSILLILILLVVGCNKSEENKQLTISVAASLTDCMEELQDKFNETYPEIALQFNFGASGTLQQQIEQGAPVDIFFSAGTKQVKALEEAGLTEEGTTKALLRNRLVLIAGKDIKDAVSFKTLGEYPDIKVAVGEPGSVPVGQYTEEVFKTLGLNESIEKQLIFAKDVREVLSWVETGNAEVGIVYETDAKLSDVVTICDTADESWHKPIIYPATIIKDTAHLQEAQLFMTFLEGDEAKAIFTAYGFTPESDGDK